MEKNTLLKKEWNQEEVDFKYYGRNDQRQMPLWPTRTFLYISIIIFLPILLVLFIVYLIVAASILVCFSFNDNQRKSAKILSFEAWYRAPGKYLEVKETENGSSDIIISADFLHNYDELGVDSCKIETCKYLSLRKSIECTVQDHLKKGPYGAKIMDDDDRDRPRYLLHGWTDRYNPSNESSDEPEVWCTHAQTATWAAIYSWTGRLQSGGWTDWSQTQQINMRTAPDVFGYIYLFTISNPNFYDQERVVRVGRATVASPTHTPKTDGKIFARYDYGKVKFMGDFPKGDPDAYIFKGEKVLNEANLKILHRYRVMKPSLKDSHSTI